MSFVPNAFADNILSSSGPAGSIMSFLPMIIIFIIFWFLLIRPQQKKMKVHNQMLAALEKGTEVLTNGGVLGKIVSLDEQFVELEIASGVIIKVQRSAITGKLNKNIAANSK